MLVGILSDNHGHPDRVRAALRCFDALGARTLLHCGDLETPDVLRAFEGRNAWFVFGNCDESPDEFARAARSVGVRPPVDGPLELELAGRRLLMGHGHESLFSQVRNFEHGVSAPSGVTCDYLLHGHTHIARDERFGATRIINPGALHRATTYTIATLDLATDLLTHWIVPRDGPVVSPPTRFVVQ